MLERVDGDGCSIALTRQELITTDSTRGLRREQLSHVLGVRNSRGGDLEVELAGGLPIPLSMAKMPAGSNKPSEARLATSEGGY